MARLDFFATRADLDQVFAYLFKETDVRVFESYSEHEKPIREFFSFAELCDAFDVGHDKHGNASAVLLQLWSASVMRDLEIERINLIPHKCKGFKFRFRMKGLGLIQLYLGGLHERILTKTHFGHFSERGAAYWGDLKSVNWTALNKLSGQIQRHVGRKLAVAKAPGRPVLAGAYEVYKTGYALKEAAGHPYTHIPALPPR